MASLLPRSPLPRWHKRAPLAYSLPEFAAAYSLSLTKVYSEIHAGRLKAKKLGKSSRISVEDAKAWWASLSDMGGEHAT
jgi:excisionase family DNA binding protein